MTEVFIVKHYDIYDYDHQEFIIGVGESLEQAMDIIKDEIKQVAASYSCCRYSIDRWNVGARWEGWTCMTLTEEDNIKLAKELGVYKYEV